jgi:hypothetical protein
MKVSLHKRGIAGVNQGYLSSVPEMLSADYIQKNICVYLRAFADLTGFVFFEVETTV